MSSSTIRFGTYQFDSTRIRALSADVDVSLTGRVLDVDTITATVQAEHEPLLYAAQDTPVRIFRGGSQVQLGYIQSVEQVGAEFYTLRMISPLGRLAKMKHRGGVYARANLMDIVADIMGDLPYYIAPEFHEVKLDGFLPYVSPAGEDGARTGSAKDNLLQVLFAVNAAIRDDADGVLRIENLPSGVTSVIDADKTYLGSFSLRREQPITSVTVIEHQFIPGSEETVLFSGTASAGQVIVFREPMASVSAQGFSVTQSGANYAVLSSGSGTLTGVPYVHTTREITRAVSSTITKAGREVVLRGSEDGTAFDAVPAGTYYLRYSFPVGYSGYISFQTTGAIPYSGLPLDVTVHVRLDADGNFYADGSSIAIGSYGPWPITLGKASGATDGFMISVNYNEEELFYYEAPIALPNEVRVEDMTMVSVYNSADVTRRLAAYYACRTWAECDAILQHEDAGDVVSLYNSFSGQQISACIERISPVEFSNIMRGHLSALVGFTPWQTVPYDDVVEVLIGSGTWRASEHPGVTQIEVVCVGGGDGGGAGEAGEASKILRNASYTDDFGAEMGAEVRQYKYSTPSALPGYGAGGAAGTPGAGGKIFRASVSLDGSESFSYRAGAGGAGEVFGGAAAQAGGATTFGAFSSADGSSSDAGFSLPGSDTVYGAKGAEGMPGKEGCGIESGDWLKKPVVWHQPEPIVVDGVSYTHGTDDQSGGGPAYQSNGGDREPPTYEFLYDGYGGAGATALPPPAASGIGRGGTGGNGGGGAGQNIVGGHRVFKPSDNRDHVILQPPPGGNGSNGGAGASGAVILIYRVPASNS